MTIKDIAKRALSYFKDQNYIFTPNEYEEIFCKEAKKANVITKDCNKVAEYIKKLDSVDIVYQDAFSPKVNRELWTIEYFREIERLNPAIITTYSVATPVRYALHTLGYNLYTHPYDNIRKGTLASKQSLPFPSANFEEKLKRVEPFYFTCKI